MLVGQLGARANDGATEPLGQYFAILVHFPLDRKAEAVFRWVKRAQVLTEWPWQHWDDLINQVCGSSPLTGHPIQGSLFPHKVGDISNVDSNPVETVCFF